MHTSVRRHSSSPLWAPRSTHAGFSLLPPPARRSRVAGRGRGGGVAGRGERAARTTRRLARAPIDSRALVDEAPPGKRPPPRSGFARVGPPRHSLREREGGRCAPPHPHHPGTPIKVQGTRRKPLIPADKPVTHLPLRPKEYR